MNNIDYGHDTRHGLVTRLQSSGSLTGYAARRANPVSVAAILAIGIATGAGATMTLKSCSSIPAPACVKSHGADVDEQKKIRFAKYFEKNGSKTPGILADAVLAAKPSNQRLLAAVAVKETGGNPHVRRGGLNGRHAGAFQVNPKYHGRVSYDPVEQALQAERILEDLVAAKGDITAALNSYGGDKTRRVYAQNILAELAEVPK